MEKWAKNNKQTSDSWVGQLIDPGNYYLIPENDWIRWANDSDVMTDIGSGDLTIARANSGEDITDINEAINYLKHRLPRDIRHDHFKTLPQIVVSTAEVGLNNVSQAYTEVYSYTGSGELHSFAVEFNNKNIKFKLEVDATNIVEIDGDFLHSLATYDNISASNTLWVRWDRSNDTLYFNPRYHLPFSSSVKLLAKADSNSNSRSVGRYIVDMVKET